MSEMIALILILELEPVVEYDQTLVFYFKVCEQVYLQSSRPLASTSETADARMDITINIYLTVAGSYNKRYSTFFVSEQLMLMRFKCSS